MERCVIEKWRTKETYHLKVDRRDMDGFRWNEGINGPIIEEFDREGEKKIEREDLGFLNCLLSSKQC